MKINNDATYKVEFKDRRSKDSYWLDMQCLTVKREQCLAMQQSTGATVYQLMTLYHDIDAGYKIYGGFLEFIQEIYPSVLNYLKIEEC